MFNWSEKIGTWFLSLALGRGGTVVDTNFHIAIKHLSCLAD